MSAPVRVSVVVTACNRGEQLGLLVAALERQTIKGRVPFEFILVDNRSTDSTATVVRNYAATAGFPIVYAYEERQGKAYALNKAMSLVRGAIVAFTDDDGIPSPDWLEGIVQYFDAQPDVACIGGRVELYDPKDMPNFLRLSRAAAVFDIANFDIANIPIIGCNMSIRSAALRLLGPYDSDFGPGSRVGSGDDVDMLYRMLCAGGRIDYVPSLEVFHNHGRRTRVEVQRVLERYVIGRGGFYCKYLMKRDRRIGKYVYWELSALLKHALRRGFVTRDARSSLKTLRLLATGALRYLRYGHREHRLPTFAPAQIGHLDRRAWERKEHL